MSVVNRWFSSCHLCRYRFSLLFSSYIFHWFSKQKTSAIMIAYITYHISYLNKFETNFDIDNIGIISNRTDIFIVICHKMIVEFTCFISLYYKKPIIDRIFVIIEKKKDKSLMKLPKINVKIKMRNEHRNDFFISNDRQKVYQKKLVSFVIWRVQLCTWPRRFFLSFSSSSFSSSTTRFFCYSIITMNNNW